MCRILEVSKSGYYKYIKLKTSKNESQDVVLQMILKIHDMSDRTYGSPRVVKELHKQGLSINHKKVERIMRENGIRSQIKQKYRICTTDSNHQLPVADNFLDRNFNVSSPGEAYVSDITYIQVGFVWCYLCVIIDLYNREVIGWSLADHMEVSLVKSAFSSAIKNQKPKEGCIFHSDRGSQYASYEFRDLLAKHNFLQSMSRKGNCWDNAVAESFFKTLKVERIYRKKYESILQAKYDLFKYIEIFYNRKRIHLTLKGMSPIEFKEQNKAA